MTDRIRRFMETYKQAWETRDDTLLCSLFAPDGVYHNTPFDRQVGHAAIAQYWDRVKLQDDIHFDYAVVAKTPTGGVATWSTRYRVTSEKMFAIGGDGYARAQAGSGAASPQTGGDRRHRIRKRRPMQQFPHLVALAVGRSVCLMIAALRHSTKRVG
jgi:uncharacterized protein (TIGR02246 family)